MAQKAVTGRGVCIRMACQAFGISESCYRYERKLDAENAEVANWLLGLWLLLPVSAQRQGQQNRTTSVSTATAESWSSTYGSNPNPANG